MIFRVRSAKAVKITDASLIKKLGLLCGFVSVALLIRTLVSPPDVIVGRTADNLKAFLCKTDWWDHTFTSRKYQRRQDAINVLLNFFYSSTVEVLFLAWGVRLCIMVRKAPSEFNESRFISMAIYNEFLLTCFLNVSMWVASGPLFCFHFFRHSVFFFVIFYLQLLFLFSGVKRKHFPSFIPGCTMKEHKNYCHYYFMPRDSGGVGFSAPRWSVKNILTS